MEFSKFLISNLYNTFKFTGMRFALTQIKAAIVEILSKFDIKVNPKTSKENIFDPISIITKLKGDVWLDFFDRK